MLRIAIAVRNGATASPPKSPKARFSVAEIHCRDAGQTRDLPDLIAKKTDSSKAQGRAASYRLGIGEFGGAVGVGKTQLEL